MCGFSRAALTARSIGDKAHHSKRITPQIDERIGHDGVLAVDAWFVGKRERHVRQALALEEQRCFCCQRRYIIEPDVDDSAPALRIDQQWFSGWHGDFGCDSARAQTALSDEPLWWMLQGSINRGPRCLTSRTFGESGDRHDGAFAGSLAQEMAYAARRAWPDRCRGPTACERDDPSSCPTGGVRDVGQRVSGAPIGTLSARL